MEKKKQELVIDFPMAVKIIAVLVIIINAIFLILNTFYGKNFDMMPIISSLSMALMCLALGPKLEQCKGM